VLLRITADTASCALCGAPHKAEFERNLVRERTQAGLSAARARGRNGGRPKTLDPAKRQLVVQLYDAKQHTISEICRMMGISKPTLYNYLSEAR
jgi:DNA invertase Pin-like site-specific DNA recombinase